MAPRWKAARARALELAFPGRCLACGERLDLETDPALPVCSACRLLLSPIRGPRCSNCGMPLLVEERVCSRCRPAPWSFSANVSVFAYAGLVQDLVIAMKSGGRRRLAGLFAPFLAAELHSRYPGVPVVPAPPRPGRRSADAVECLARELERRHGVRVIRARARSGGAAQKTLSYEERLRNLEGRIRATAVVSSETVLLDDVFTTGATADACSRALLRAGCPRVSVVTLGIAI